MPLSLVPRPKHPPATAKWQSCTATGEHQICITPSTSTMATTSPERFAEDEDGGDHADEWDQQ
jgi:hypothetical protein